MNNCFLEGEKGAGKSTFLQQLLLSRKESVAGFFVVRKITDKQKIVGFELHDASALTGEVTSSRPLNDEYCFLRKEKGEMVYHEHVFRLLGREWLRQAKSQPNRIVLLDEIGGVELLDHVVFDLIMNLLESRQKVVGVYKSEANFSSQSLSADLKNQLFEKREKIESLLKKTEENSFILHWQEEIKEKIRRQYQDFLD